MASSEVTQQSLEEIAADRLEIDNLHTLNTVLAINRDHQKVDQNWTDTREMLRRGQPHKLTGECEGAKAAEMKDEDTVNWKTTENHHHYPAPQAPAPQPSTLSKLAGPLLIAASLLGTGGIGTAGYVAVKAIEQIAAKQSPGKVEDGQIQIEFIGGESSPVEPAGL